jgi:ubiquinone/menaquinone biosynthesis C-methylase UbiE
MSNHHNQLSEGNTMVFDRVVVFLQDFPGVGRVLDIGGGGEGIVGLLKNSAVIAVDRRREELEEAPPGPLKIVMDARRMGFPDHSFGQTTAFFSFCYMKGEDHETVFEEVHRVLKPGGSFRIWDVIYPARSNTEKQYILIPLTVELPATRIETSYGVNWDDGGRDLEHYKRLGTNNGFEITNAREDGSSFFLCLHRP